MGTKPIKTMKKFSAIIYGSSRTDCYAHALDGHILSELKTQAKSFKQTIIVLDKGIPVIFIGRGGGCYEIKLERILPKRKP